MEEKDDLTKSNRNYMDYKGFQIYKSANVNMNGVFDIYQGGRYVSRATDFNHAKIIIDEELS